MKKITAFLTIMTALRIFAADGTITANTVTPEKYPDADTVLLNDRTWTRYYPNGTSIETNDEYTVILTEKGRRGALTRSFGYSALYGTVKILEAEVISPNGTAETIDIAANSAEMIDSSQMGSNIYDPNSKEIRLSFPKLKPGDTIHIKTERSTFKARVPNTWSDYSIFEWDCPIVFCSEEISAPAELPLSNIRLRSEFKDRIKYTQTKQADGTITHKWTAENIPQAFPEPDMPPMHTVVSRLLVSTIPDWKNISKWYWNLSKPRLDAVSDEMKAEVDKLTADAATDNEKIQRIFSFVSQKIRYMGLTLENEAPGYEPHDVSLTFANKYGVCRDKAALLVSMLRLAGLDAYPVLINSGPKKDPDVPQPYFNHAIAAVELKPSNASTVQNTAATQKYILMDPTDEKTRDYLPGYLRNMSYLVAKPEGEDLLDTGPVPAEDNLVHIRTNGSIDDEGTLSFNTKINFTGVNDNIYRNFFARRKPDERKRYFEGELSSAVPSATMFSFRILPEDPSDTSHPLSVEFSCIAKNHAIEGSGATVIRLPRLVESIGIANWVVGRTGLLKRRFPLKTEPTCGVAEDIGITLPEKWNKLIAEPKTDVIDTKGITFSRTFSATNNPDHGNMLVSAEKFLIKSPEFTPEEYLELRENLKTIEIDRKPEPVFTSKDTEADIKTIFHKISIDIASQHEWTNTVHRKIKVLTYAGIKNNSEIRISYNPVYDEVEIIKASVFMQDGTAKEITGKEINIMDAAWTADAPRYPAGKILVANLPGVEVGSEIETIIRTTRKDRPFLSARVTFAEHNPADEFAAKISFNTNTIRYPGDLTLFRNQKKAGSQWDLETATNFNGNGFMTLSFRRTNINAVPPEDGQQPIWRFNPMISFSTGKESMPFAVNAKINEILAAPDAISSVTGITARIATKEMPLRERVKAIRDYVAINIRPAGPSPFSLPLSSFSPPSTTLKDGYGHRADIAIVLKAMLNAAGIENETVFASSTPFRWNELFNSGIGEQQDIAGAILIKVREEGNPGFTFWLNDSDQYGEPGTTIFNGYPCFTATNDSGFTTNTIRDLVQGSGTQYDFNVILDREGDAEISYKMILRDESIQNFRKKYTEITPEDFRRDHQETIAEFSPSAVADGDMEIDMDGPEAEMNLKMKIPAFAVREGNLLILDAQTEGVPITLRSENRETGWCRSDFSTSESTFTVAVPDGVTDIPVLPPDYSLSLCGIRCTGHSNVNRRNDGTVESITVKTISGTEWPHADIDEYQALYSALKKLSHPKYSTIVIQLPEL